MSDQRPGEEQQQADGSGDAETRDDDAERDPDGARELEEPEVPVGRGREADVVGALHHRVPRGQATSPPGPCCRRSADLDGRPDLVEAAVRAGRRPLADGALERLAERAVASGTPLALGLLARAEALLTTDDRARARYEEAIERLGQAGDTHQWARAHLAYGEWLRRQRKRRDARDQLHRALELFDKIGLHPSAERARMELRATGEHPHRRDTGEREDLTPQEAQIASLVSLGHTNREVAAQLFISPNTVEYHLRKVFRKLGVTSRTQLARLLMADAVGVSRLPPRDPGAAVAEAATPARPGVTGASCSAGRSCPRRNARCGGSTQPPAEVCGTIAARYRAADACLIAARHRP